MGATLTAEGCDFRVWAPNAAAVAVMGSFNEWKKDEFPMSRDEDGCWQVAVPGVRAGDEYLFVIDNKGGDEWNPGTQSLLRCDPWARDTRHSNGNAVVVDLQHELVASGLEADPFQTPSPSDWLIYQVHIGSFVGRGDGVDTGTNTTATFQQFSEKLGHIEALRFNAIALLPVQENPGDGNEGYGPSHLFAPESSYGSPLELRQLIRSAHDRGIAVIFDVVWNHISDTDNRLWEFDGMTREGGIYFEGGGRTPWGPRLALWKREVRDMVIGHARSCFEEYHVDGIRIDAADELPTDLLREVVEAIRAEPRWHEKLLIAEWGGTDRPGKLALTDSMGFNRVWALGDPLVFRRAVGIGIGTKTSTRVNALRELVELPRAEMRIRYPSGSHDNVHDNLAGDRRGFRYLVELAGGRDDWHARAKARMAWALSIALQGTPMCFMGTECHQAGYWHPRLDDNEAQEDHRFNWERCQDDLGASMRALVHDVNQLWWSTPALRYAAVEIVHLDEVSGVMGLLRRDPNGGSVLVIVNSSENAWPDGGYQLPFPEWQSAWQVLLDTQAAAYAGDALDHDQSGSVENGFLGLSIPRWSVLFLGSA